nr:MAG TPA: hypothetical protein [Caudoviricetes sp.]
MIIISSFIVSVILKSPFFFVDLKSQRQYNICVIICQLFFLFLLI